MACKQKLQLLQYCGATLACASIALLIANHALFIRSSATLTAFWQLKCICKYVHGNKLLGHARLILCN